MYWRGLIAPSLMAACVVRAPGLASGQPSDEAVVEAQGEPSVADQELGADLGLRLGGRTTSGGLRITGRYLYRLSGNTWSESSFGVTIGSGAAACFRDRTNDRVCDHGALSGRDFGIASGLRWQLPGRQGVDPYVQAGLGLEYLAFPGDEIRGLAIPAIVGGGARWRVADRVSVGAGAELRAGMAWLSQDVSWEPQLSLTVRAGVEFSLD